MADQFNGLRVFLSASVPDDLRKCQQKLQDRLQLIASLSEQIFKRGGVLVFGGHPSVTPLIHQTATAQFASQEKPSPSVQLFQLGGFRASAPRQVADARIFGDVNWVGSHTPDQSEEFDAELNEMRQAMMEQSDAAVFAGGKTVGFLGKQPGIRSEYDLFRETNPDNPVYLVGLLEGQTARIIEELDTSHQREVNGLNDRELWQLHHSSDVDMIVNLIVADLLSHVK